MFRQAFMMFCNRQMIGGVCTYTATKLLVRQQGKSRTEDSAQSNDNESTEESNMYGRRDNTQAPTRSFKK
jgi:hypothetical protein